MSVRQLEKTTYSIGRVGKRRQVVIPKNMCIDLGLREGDFVEVRRTQGAVLIKPKRLVDPNDTLSSQEEKAVRKGEAELRRGDYVTLAQLHNDLDRPAIKKRRKTA
jgi:AbrB family looped-hinge helix DNA binding protein